MAKRVEQDDIIRINELYLKFHTYAEVARQTGFSPSTVKKYVVADFTAPETAEKKIFSQEMIPKNVDLSLLKNKNDWGNACILRANEEEEIRELWKELSI